jgi:hypothetical protein
VQLASSLQLSGRVSGHTARVVQRERHRLAAVDAVPKGATRQLLGGTSNRSEDVEMEWDVRKTHLRWHMPHHNHDLQYGFETIERRSTTGSGVDIGHQTYSRTSSLTISIPTIRHTHDSSGAFGAAFRRFNSCHKNTANTHFLSAYSPFTIAPSREAYHLQILSRRLDEHRERVQPVHHGVSVRIDTTNHGLCLKKVERTGTDVVMLELYPL